MRRSVVEVIDTNSQVLLAKPQNLLDENVYSFDFDLSDPDSGFLQLTLQPPAHLCRRRRTQRNLSCSNMSRFLILDGPSSAVSTSIPVPDGFLKELAEI